jgi:hypothetical protein
MKIKLDDPIYVMTLIAPTLNGKATSSHRVVGYAHTLEYAKEIVNKNQSDLHECLYEYIVIEKICEGVFRTVQNEYWYEWNEKNQTWNECCKPKKYRQIINFGIG